MTSTDTSFPTTVILAGGLGTRLGAVAQQTPKCLMELAGQPFIAHQLTLLKREGVSKVVLCIGHLGEQVQNYVGDGSRFGLDVQYVFDGAKLLGTGGAIRRAIELGALTDEHFAVTYGDSYLDVSFPPIYQSFLQSFVASKKKALMTVLLNENRWDKSNVIVKDGSINCYDKKNQSSDMRHIDFGLLIFSHRCFEDYPADQVFDLSSMLQTLVSEQQLAAFEVHQRFYEIGTPESLAETDRYLQSVTNEAVLSACQGSYQPRGEKVSLAEQ